MNEHMTAKEKMLSEAIAERQREVAMTYGNDVTKNRRVRNSHIWAAASAAAKRMRAAFNPDWHVYDIDQEFFYPPRLVEIFEEGRKPRGLMYLSGNKRSSGSVRVQCTIAGVSSILAQVPEQWAQRAALLHDIIEYHFREYRRQGFNPAKVLNCETIEAAADAHSRCSALREILMEMELSLLNAGVICPWAIRDPKRPSAKDRAQRRDLALKLTEAHKQLDIIHTFASRVNKLELTFAEISQRLKLLEGQKTATQVNDEQSEVKLLKMKVAALEARADSCSADVIHGMLDERLNALEAARQPVVGRVNENIDALKKIEEILKAVARRQDVLASQQKALQDFVRQRDGILTDVVTKHNQVANEVRELPVLLEQLKRHLP